MKSEAIVKLTQGEQFDSYTVLTDLIDGESEITEDYNLDNYDLLNSVPDALQYKIGQQVLVDYDGNNLIEWEGEIAGIFADKLLVYLY